MPDRAYLHPIDPELRPGARNAIELSATKPQERITIIRERPPRHRGGVAIGSGARSGLGQPCVLEHHARRPLSYMPENILDDLALSQVLSSPRRANRVNSSHAPR